MKLTIPLLTILFITSCSVKKTTAISNYKIIELEYGISNSKETSKQTMMSSPTGEHIFGGTRLNVIKKTDTIVMKDGVQFGVSYSIKSTSERNINLTTVWKYPKGMKDYYNNLITETRYNIEKNTNEYNYSNYTLDENCLIKGTWTLELYDGEILLYTKNFYLE